MPTILTLREAAERLGVPPRKLSDGFYAGWLTRQHCEFLGTRRIIPEEYLDRIKAALQSRRAAASK